VIAEASRHPSSTASGPDQVDDVVVTKLGRPITAADRQSFTKDLIHAPDWMGELLRPMWKTPAAE